MKRFHTLLKISFLAGVLLITAGIIFAQTVNFLSTSQATAEPIAGAQVIGIATCPDGKYMAGLDVAGGSGDWWVRQIYCAPAPTGFVFPSTSQATAEPIAGAQVIGIATCPNGKYMAGLDVAGGSGDWWVRQIYCATPVPTGNLGQACNINGTCNTGLVCQGGMCVAVGGLGQTCLAGSTCNSGFICDVSNICQDPNTVGGNGQVCLAGSLCDRGQDRCISGYCYASGGTGEYCNRDASCNSSGDYCCSAAQAGNTMCMTNPVADFTLMPNPAIGSAPFVVNVSFTGTAYGSASYTWDFGDGTTASGATATHTYQNFTLADISHTITLTSTDRCGTARTVQRTVTVRPMLPTASFTVTPQSGTAIPLSVTANAGGSASTAAGATIVSYQWDFGDNTAPFVTASPVTPHVYTNQGFYTITLRVRDMIGLSDPATVLVAVGATACPVSATDLTNRCLGTNAPVCAPADDGSGGQCVQCIADSQCGPGYSCLGTPCAKRSFCPDSAACPLDGRCPKILKSCDSAAGELCPDGSACPSSGPARNICEQKNECVLSANSVAAQCYVEGIGSTCTRNSDCTASVQGGACVAGVCEYARCLNTTATPCDPAKGDADCSNGDGICNTISRVCEYSYDCAYGPGMGVGTARNYATSSIPVMPKMPIGVQPNGEACTQPTPTAPNNCEGINGCLYYNYNTNGTPIAGSNNSVANCLNKFEGGTGCVYYGDPASANYKVNCLADLTAKSSPKISNNAGIPQNCFVTDKGQGKKDYDCSAVDGCYYYADGSIDCTYTDGIAGGVSGNGCLYDPTPAGATFCPGVSKPPTAGDNFVQCLLNPDATLPGFATGTSSSALLPCKTRADCPADNICLNGTCYPICQGNTDCASGLQCMVPPTTITITTSTIPACRGAIPPVPCSFPSACSDGQACLSTGYCPLPLAFSATQSDIGLATLAAATCKYDPTYSATLYSATTATIFSITGGTGHLSSGVAVLPGTNTFYAQCQDAGTGTLTPVCQISFGVGPPCSTSAQCSGSLSCISGICQPPYCNGALVNGSIPPVALASGTASASISMQTQNTSGAPLNATCKYSPTVPVGSTPLAQYIAMPNTFTPGGTSNHASTVSPLTDGTVYRNYVLCQEAALPNKITPLCQIPFSVNVCSANFACQNGWACTNPPNGTGICIPACKNPIPPDTCIAGNACADGQICPLTGFCPLPLAYGTPDTDIGLTTDLNAFCRYDTTYSRALYTAPTAVAFATTGTTSHLTNVAGLFPGTNTYFAQCKNAANTNLTQVCSISFGVGKPCSKDTQCDGQLLCIDNICQLPVCDNASPTGILPVGTVGTPIGLTTDKNTACRYANSNTSYASMTDFSTTGAMAHSTTVSGLVPGNDTQYIGCQETALPNQITYCRIPFSVAGASSIVCPSGWFYDAVLGVCVGGGSPNCPSGSTPDPVTGLCISNNICSLPSPPAFCNVTGILPATGMLSCNTLGVTFFNTAVTPTGNCDLVAILLALLNWLAWIVSLLAVLSGLRAAYLYITSVGDEKRLNLAKSYLIYTTIGVGVAVLSFGIVAITRAILNI